jgi:Dyp-type peroxidase family
MAGADMSARNPSPREPEDMQALLRGGLGRLTAACFLLLEITDPAAARTWLAALRPTNATVADHQADTALQVALSMPGLAKLGVSGDGFAHEFRLGMMREDAARRMGDVADNAPVKWRWGGTAVPDILLLHYARMAQAEWDAYADNAVLAPGLKILRVLRPRQMRADKENYEPFGFKDGISQPVLDWDGQRNPSLEQELGYANAIAPGEFVLGYRNEYGLYTDRPLLDAGVPGAELLSAAEDHPSLRDLGRNGSFLVLRELHQDVDAFWDFMLHKADSEPGAVALAEAMVGRRRNGDPMVAGGAAKDSDFSYDADPEGVLCPVGSHVRRAHPRTADMPGGPRCIFARLANILGFPRPRARDDLIAASRFHRILRRGRPFGAPPPELPARPAPGGGPVGLYFMCLNANIARQFEFVQNAWLHHAKFAGLDGEGDPLTGNREKFPPGTRTDGFSQARENGVRERIDGLPRFVTVKGGGYFFLPGLSALRFIVRQPG